MFSVKILIEKKYMKICVKILKILKNNILYLKFTMCSYIIRWITQVVYETYTYLNGC